MVFNVGDRVRFKDDKTNQYWSVVNIYPSISKVQILSDCGNISKVVEPLLLVPYDPVSEIKQAIREVLLSEEFLTAFAAAWQKTPLVHVDEMKLAIEPITGSESEAYYLNKLKNGESK